MNQETSWGVVIVAYNPDLTLLEQTVEQVYQLTPNVVVVNNGKRIDTFSYSETVHELNQNRGIAFAQNAGVRYLTEKQPSIERVFLLDQDSVMNTSFFQSMNNEWMLLKKKHSKLGALSPVIHQKDTSKNYSLLTFSKQRIKRQQIMINSGSQVWSTLPIASGMLINVEAYQYIGGMDEQWFIDWVDFDFDLRLLSAGFEIATTGLVAINHKIGTPRKRKFFSKQIAILNYVLFREYYYFRNGIYMLKRHARIGNGIGALVMGQLGRRIIAIYYETHPLKRMCEILKGILTGIFTKP